ncbi:hypothetical protein GCM10028811_31960 [Uliginosibacterium sediminicola]
MPFQTRREHHLDIRLPPRLARFGFLQSVLPAVSFSIAPSTREMSSWVAGLPAEQPLVVLDSLAERAKAVAHSSVSPSRRFRQLEQLAQHAEPLLKRLEAQLDACRLPLDSASKAAANTADRLLKSLSEAHLHIVQTIKPSSIQRRLHGKTFAMAMLRAAQLINRRSAVVHRAHAAGSPRRWKLLRKLLEIGEQYALLNQPAIPGSSDTLEQAIARECLMSLCDPASLENSELGRIRFYIERFGHLAKLRKEVSLFEDTSAGLFVFGNGPRGPSQLRADQVLGDKERVLDCRELLARARHHLAGLRQGLHATKLGLPMVANEASYAYMLSRCVEQWSEAKTRRHTREDYLPLAELVSGFDAIRQFLSSTAFRRRESDRLQGAGAGLSVASEWRILDQSRSGFGLRQASAHTLPVSIGEVVAMRPLERSHVHICVTRRLRHEDEGCNIGLERLSGSALPTLIEKTLADGSTHSIPVLLLPRSVCFDGGPAMLAPHDDVTVGMVLRVAQREGDLRFRLEGVSERLASCELWQLTRI